MLIKHVFFLCFVVTVLLLHTNLNALCDSRVGGLCLRDASSAVLSLKAEK